MLSALRIQGRAFLLWNILHADIRQFDSIEALLQYILLSCLFFDYFVKPSLYIHVCPADKNTVNILKTTAFL